MKKGVRRKVISNRCLSSKIQEKPSKFKGFHSSRM